MSGHTTSRRATFVALSFLGVLSLALPSSAAYFADSFAENSLEDYVFPRYSLPYWDSGPSIGGQSGRLTVYNGIPPFGSLERTDGVDRTLTYQDPVFSFATSGATSVTAEAIVFHNFPGGGNLDSLSLGLGTTQGTATDGEPMVGLWGQTTVPWWGFGVDLRHTDATGFFLRTYVDGSDVVSHNAESSLASSPGFGQRWVKLSMTLTWANALAPDDLPLIDLSASLQDYGADGTTPGAVLLTATRSAISTSQMQVDEHDFYVGLKMRGRRDEGRGGSEILGSLAVVPEPAALSLVALSAVLLGRRHRRNAK